jgi:hypothetical protein
LKHLHKRGQHVPGNTLFWNSAQPKRHATAVVYFGSAEQENLIARRVLAFDPFSTRTSDFCSARQEKTMLELLGTSNATQSRATCDFAPKLFESPDRHKLMPCIFIQF